MPEIGFYNEYRKYQEENVRMMRFYESRTDFDYEAELDNLEARNLVIVIGESLNRHHMSLYGYPRNTTPKLSAIRDELLVYRDVISPSRATMNVMNKVLTFANNENEDAFYTSPSVIEILKKVGYKVWWIDNQGESDKVRPNSYRKIADMSDVMYVLPKIVPDTAVLIKFSEALADTCDKKVIFLHLIGSHIPYEDDVPEECRWWAAEDTTDIISLQPRETIRQNLTEINMYDNTVRYNDRIISYVIDYLRQKEGAQAMLYFSDHGEEMCESAPFTCRSLECLTRGQCDIPFILWRNEVYKQLIPIHIDVDASYCTDDVNYAVLELAGVNCNLVDSTKSIFSKGFAPKNRKLDYMYYDSLPVYKVRKIER